MLEAGLAWFCRYGTWPTSEAWNSTHVRDAAILRSGDDSGEAYARWLSGYHPIAESTRLLPWPAQAAVWDVFGGFPIYIEKLRAWRRELEQNGTPYTPIPLDPSHVALCELRGMVPCAPDGVPLADENKWMLSVGGVLTLLALCGELEMHDAYLRAAGDPDALEFRWPPTDGPPATGLPA